VVVLLHCSNGPCREVVAAVVVLVVVRVVEIEVVVVVVVLVVVRGVEIVVVLVVVLARCSRSNSRGSGSSGIDDR
jgi:hypothetical protein